MPLSAPFRTAFGNDEVIESVLVRMSACDSYGWGEASPWALPAYSAEWAAGTFLVIRNLLAPLLLGREIDSGATLQSHLSGIKGNFFAKAALDTAWWDLHARSQGQPLWKVLGGSDKPVAVGEDFGVMESIDALLAVIDDAVQAGFPRVKLKYRPGWDLDMITAVRDSFPDTVFHIDCNSAYTLDDLPMFQKLDRFGLAMIEQPLANDDLVDHATLQGELNTPICLDESITSADKARKAIALGACRWVNIKPGRVGGLTPAVEVHDRCRDAGIPCWIGGMLESAVGASHCLALATLPNIGYPSDIFATRRFYPGDLAHPEMVLAGPGKMAPSATPGVGAEPDPDRLQAGAIEQATLQSE